MSFYLKQSRLLKCHGIGKRHLVGDDCQHSERPTVLVRALAVKRHHDQDNSHKGQHVTGGLLPVSDGRSAISTVESVVAHMTLGQ